MLSAIVLMTDFGNRDPYVAIMKGVIHRINPQAVLIDAAHDLPPFKILSASYSLYNMYPWYPPGTIFTIVVDPGVGTERKALIAHAKGYWFVAPDNGLLYPIISEDPEARVYFIKEKELHGLASKISGITDWKVSNTFHGRDIFAPAAALLSLGTTLYEWTARATVRDIVKLSLFWKGEKGESVVYNIVNIDRFGNVALSIRFKDFPFRGVELIRVSSANGDFLARKVKTFGEVPKGTIVFYENSFGFLEIGVNQGNAANVLGVDIGDKLELTLQ